MAHKQSTSITGTINRIFNCGTIVMVWLRTRRGWLEPVYFDHSCFRHLLEGEQCQPADLIGRRASFDGDALKLDEVANDCQQQ